jgi:hypothetical protein
LADDTIKQDACTLTLLALSSIFNRMSKQALGRRHDQTRGLHTHFAGLVIDFPSDE